MADDPVDTGFDAVLAGEAYAHPEPAAPSDGAIYAAVSRAATPPAEQAALDAEIDARLAASPEITATVNDEISPPNLVTTPGLTPAGVQAAKALVHLPALDWPTLSKLAREMAMDIKERGVILTEFKLSEPQYEYLEANNEFYRNAFANACKEWHAPLSTQERIKVEAAAILEDSLLGIGARMQNKGEGLPGVIEAAKLFAKVAGVGERESSGAAPGERFTINIDLGGDKTLAVEVATPARLDAGGDLLRSIPAHGEAP